MHKRSSAVYSVSSGALQQLAADPDVLYITPNRGVKATLDLRQPRCRANAALFYGYTGAGVTVAVIDSGVNDGMADRQGRRGSRMLYSESFARNDRSTFCRSGQAFHHHRPRDIFYC